MATTLDGYTATVSGTTTTIHDVPIFCACERGGFNASEQWVRGAVAKALRRGLENYFPPLHVRHHEPDTARTDSVTAAGYFRITGTAPITLGGRRRTAVLADLVVTDPTVADDIMGMRLPYRSVEIFDVEAEPSIDGLALLDHEAPYLELPMLEVGQVVEASSVAPAIFRTPTDAAGAGGVVAYSQHANRASFLFRADTMTTSTTELDTDAVQAPAVALAADGPPQKKDEDKGEDMAEEGGLDVSAVCAAIESGEISIADMDAILASIQAQKPQEPEMDEEAPAQAAAPVENMRAAGGQNFAKLQGKIDALTARLEARDESDAVASDVAGAMAELAGLPLGSNIEAKLVAFRTKHPADAFADYVECFKQNVAPVPAGGTAASNFANLGGKLPEVAMKYQDQGTEAVEQAARYSSEWNRLRQTSAGVRASEESYVRINMARAAR